MSMYVVTHKVVDTKLPDNYKTIVVNSQINKIKGDLYDCNGDNISEKNYAYCELTAIYYIWKNNVNNDDYIGIDHYRRFLIKDDAYLRKNDIEWIFKNYDVILPEKIHFIRNISNQYINTCGYKNDLNEVEKAIKKLHPEYLEAYKKIMRGHEMYAYNMFVFKYDIYRDYCKWLFSVLFEVENNIDAYSRKGYFRRVFGFIAERLLNVYVLYKGYNICELPVRYTGSRESLIAKVENKVKKISDKYKGM